MAYPTKTNWVNGQAPWLDATNLNKIEQGIFDANKQETVYTNALNSNGNDNIAILKHLIPTIDDTQDLGNATLAYRYIYAYSMDIDNISSKSSSTVAISDFTELGELSPGIKQKTVTGTSASAEGGTVNISHGVAVGKIVDYKILLDFSSTTRIPENFTGNNGFQYNSYIADTSFNIENITANSSAILSKPISILVTYEL